jgi:hypothetical protein
VPAILVERNMSANSFSSYYINSHKSDKNILADEKVKSKSTLKNPYNN